MKWFDTHDDARNSAVVHVWQNIHKFDPSRGSLRNFVYMYASNGLVKGLRAGGTLSVTRIERGHLRVYGTPIQNDPAPLFHRIEKPDNTTSHVDTDQHVTYLMGKLHSRDRDFVTAFLNEPTISAASKKLGISRERGRQYMERIKERLCSAT